MSKIKGPGLLLPIIAIVCTGFAIEYAKNNNIGSPIITVLNVAFVLMIVVELAIVIPFYYRRLRSDKSEKR